MVMTVPTDRQRCAWKASSGWRSYGSAPGWTAGVAPAAPAGGSRAARWSGTGGGRRLAALGGSSSISRISAGARLYDPAAVLDRRIAMLPGIDVLSPVRQESCRRIEAIVERACDAVSADPAGAAAKDGDHCRPKALARRVLRRLGQIAVRYRSHDHGSSAARSDRDAIRWRCWSPAAGPRMRRWSNLPGTFRRPRRRDRRVRAARASPGAGSSCSKQEPKVECAALDFEAMSRSARCRQPIDWVTTSITVRRDDHDRRALTIADPQLHPRDVRRRGSPIPTKGDPPADRTARGGRCDPTRS